MNKVQLNKVAQTYTNKYYNDRELSVKASEEIVDMILNDLETFEELYKTTDIFELVDVVAADVIANM